MLNSLLLLVFRNNSTFYVSINLLAFADEAKKYREMSVKPSLPETVRKLAIQAEVAVDRGQYEAAAALYQDALRLAPWWPEGHFNRAIILSNLRRFKEAVAQMKKYLLLAPDAKDARTAQDNMYKWEAME